MGEPLSLESAPPKAGRPKAATPVAAAVCGAVGVRLRAFVAIACWLLIQLLAPHTLAPSTAWGEVTGQELCFPEPITSSSNPRAIALEIDPTWYAEHGYRPISFRFEVATPAAKDQPLLVRADVYSSRVRNLERPTLVVERRFTLPAGESELSGQLLAPQIDDWNVLRCSARLGEGDTARRIEGFASLPQLGSQTASPLRLLRPSFRGGETLSQAEVEKVVRARRRMVSHELVLCSWSDDWKQYSSADAVVVSLDELRRLPDADSAALKALLRWTAAGGDLWIERVGGKLETLEEIAVLIDADDWRQRALRSTEEVDPESPGWAWLTNAQSDDDPDDGDSDSSADKPDPDASEPLRESDEGLGDSDDSLRSDRDDRDLDRKETTRGWFVARSYGLGRVLAFQDAYSLRQADRRRDQNSMPREFFFEGAWSKRHGLTPPRPSREFSNLLIPGVGLAPVMEFQGLITLFVLVIGPLNYWLLMRRHRLSLLVLTVPACALLVTLGFFAYAMLGDGFGNRARVRSVTLIDQTGPRAGEAVCWSRLSMYCGLTPQGGLRMPSDTVVYPISPISSDWLQEGVAEQTRVMRWADVEEGASESQEIDGSQHLSQGWISGRSPVQYLTIAARQTDKRLRFAEEESGMSVRNGLGAPLTLLYARDEAGQWHRTSGVAADGVARLEPADLINDSSEFRDLVIANDPLYPPGLDGQGGTVFSNRKRLSAAEVLLVNSAYNQLIAVVSGRTGGGALDLPPRSYVAVTNQAVESRFGLEDVEEIGSFHLVVGRW
ncbi:hypothetical protein Mal64_03100 [Pseudobythopirellula maris]|uniref:Uncharacterized protein n=1 Tax=Pseudobythopirellula maris TaxID=2527991 RepID=A0A5C5ZS87_9BACT|nr:hypothetical protein [Pseudobythopirellula maris]TWT89928.1 hypothetical protein Mal64_03100 [Pseudobythopirellula maris]